MNHIDWLLNFLVPVNNVLQAAFAVPELWGSAELILLVAFFVEPQGLPHKPTIPPAGKPLAKLPHVGNSLRLVVK